MPPIDYREARSRVRLAEVLDLIGFAASWRRGVQVRGPCPVHRSRTPTSRSFAADHGSNCGIASAAASAATGSTCGRR
jgi:hypothetical protein